MQPNWPYIPSFQMKTKTWNHPNFHPPAHHPSHQLWTPNPAAEPVVLTSTFGNSLRNFWLHLNTMAPQYVGWIAVKAYSKSRIVFVLRNSGAAGKTDPQWTTINYHDQFDNTTKKESWRKQKDHNVWSTSFVIRTICNHRLKAWSVDLS